jgi:pyridoxamine 5'-phosphate oxidase
MGTHAGHDIQLDPATAPTTPFELFQEWYEQAKTDREDLADAMALATSTRDGVPSNRFVLLKRADPDGFVFFTNYESRKGGELDQNPRAAAALFWHRPRRQVRIEGTVTRLAEAESDEYFAGRDRESQISASASPQSCSVSSREELERMVSDLRLRFASGAVPRPAHWGGFRITPFAVEFWQSRDARLHDRIRYRLSSDGSWNLERLAP